MSSGIKSKSLVLTSPERSLEIRERVVPPPSPGCINIEVLRAGVCGTDVHLWKGDQPLPGSVVLGHEGLGRVIELGSGVQTDHASNPIAVGDVIYWNPIRPCNACYHCTISQDFTACENGTFWSLANNTTVWASYTQVATLLPNNSFYKVDPNVPFDAYIALGCALPTMLQAVDHLGHIPGGSNVVVQGAGPVGLAAIMMAKLAGAAHIICIEGNPVRLEQARSFGATALVDFREEGLQTADERKSHINSIVGARGVNLVIECSGNASAFEEGFELLTRSGTYLLVGTWAGSAKVQLSPFDVVQKALKIIGSTYCSPWCYYRAAQLVQANYQKFPLASCVTKTYSLVQAQQALEDVAAGKVVKAVIDPQA
ncbi:alcohol dehydrogenase, putative [Talaromyces marneffei ATCC 18224]|uniref:Alcohol dehydrogenase, putative n=1 Tax=Talaromyces marneffei (strain ATCC 18224 / CBS 334.59 / QM 7333) TaxID=441960 RepID=B6QBF8_TALMQ|nr:alcohol dehydrogenase, putative [Talaromyces marneffei ATCC 18224]